MNFDSLIVKNRLDKNLNVHSHQLPIFATSSFDFEDITQGIEVFAGNEKAHFYSRYGNPTIESVADKIAAMEAFGLANTEAKAVMVSSGMSAISTALLATLKAGDALLTQGNLYGGTTEMFTKIIAPLGILPIFIDLTDDIAIKNALAAHQNIRAIFLETPSNPSLVCYDIAEIAEMAHGNGAILIVDNTFCTPYLQQPFAFGADLIIHSTTKYLNGHGTATAGVVVGRDAETMRRVWQTMKLLGTNCNPFDAWLTAVGMQTLVLRMDKHCSNANELAQYLLTKSEVLAVNHPSLTQHGTHDIARKQMKNFGGMLSFELRGGYDAALRFMKRLEFCAFAPTCGDVDTLVMHPASMSHVNIDKKIREANGLTDGLIRISVGIENIADIIKDLERGFGV